MNGTRCVLWLTHSDIQSFMISFDVLIRFACLRKKSEEGRGVNEMLGSLNEIMEDLCSHFLS